jgi:hypothetical protein
VKATLPLSCLCVVISENKLGGRLSVIITPNLHRLTRKRRSCKLYRGILIVAALAMYTQADMLCAGTGRAPVRVL